MDITVDHNPSDIDGRVFLAHNGRGGVWRLTEEEAIELTACLLQARAERRQLDELADCLTSAEQAIENDERSIERAYALEPF